MIDNVDIVIIGGGPAGMAAALGAKENGAESILILERDKVLGGILNQCIHDGFGLFMYGEALSGPEFAENLIDKIHENKIPYVTDAMVMDVTKEKLVKYNSPEGYKTIQAKSIVLAMGCRERTRGMISIPGSRPAGVLTAGSAQNLVNLQNLKIGRKIAILGSGDIGLIMARRLTLEGMDVVGVFELMPWCNGLDRNLRQCLNDYGIPLYLSKTVSGINGKNRLESITVSDVNEDGTIIAGTEKTIECDTLLLSIGLIPENELSRKAGVELSPVTNGALVDEKLMTSVPGIFSCGNVLHIHDVADFASEEGYKAGSEAYKFISETYNKTELVSVKNGKSIRYCMPHHIHAGVSEVEISFRVSIPLVNQVVKVKDSVSQEILFEKKYARMIPSELEKVTIGKTINNSVEVYCHGC